MGTAIAVARAVTHNVPMIKGRNPNFPENGLQSVENNISDKGTVDKIGPALKIRPATIKINSRQANTGAASISLLERFSFNLLAFMFLEFKRK